MMTHNTNIYAVFLLLSLMITACATAPANAETIQPADTAIHPDDMETQAKAAALAALAQWATDNPTDAPQVIGATVSEVQHTSDGYHVILMKDLSSYYADGRIKEEGMHLAYFHVFLDENLNVVKVARGPDEIS
jgi:hypothetical protein